MFDLDSYKKLTYDIQQRWYHVAISFTGKKDNQARELLYHYREIFDLTIECSDYDECGIISWSLPKNIFKLNIYARNLGNNEIFYLDYNDEIDDKSEERTIILLLSELDKLPNICISRNEDKAIFYKTIRLEFDYTTSEDENNKNAFSHFGYKTYISFIRKKYNKYPEFKIIVPYGWRLELKHINLIRLNSELLKKYKALEKINGTLKENDVLKETYGKLNQINHVLCGCKKRLLCDDGLSDKDISLLENEVKKCSIDKHALINEIKKIEKQRLKQNKSIRKIKAPFYLFYTKNKEEKLLPIPASPIPITTVHTQNLEYSIMPNKMLWENKQSCVDEKQPFMLSLNILKVGYR